MKVLELQEVCEVIAGQSPPSDTYNQSNVGIPFFQGKADFGELYPTVRYWCSKPTKISIPNDILFSVRAPVGPTNINNTEACIGRGLSALRCKDDKIIMKYLLHFLRANEEIISNLGTGSTFKAITISELKKIQIPLPPLEQQKKIAAILDAADAYRQKTKALIAKYDELTQSLFLDMFGDPMKNEKGFELSSVGIQCKVKGGKRVPKNEKLVSENTGFPYIKAGNIKSGKVSLKDLEFLLPQTRERLKRYTVEKGDVCITVVGANIGDVGIVPDELHLANLTENANKILIKDKNVLNNYFLSKYLQMDFIQKNIGAKTMAVGVPKLALFRIEQIELLIPPISLQKQYKERVQVIESQKAQAQASLEKAEELFNSLLQRAFKGELE